MWSATIGIMEYKKVAGISSIINCAFSMVKDLRYGRYQSLAIFKSKAMP